MARILVLGGSGFVGRRVCELLQAGGHHVTVPTRALARARPVALLPRVSVVQADVADPASLPALVAGHDAVVNLVAILHGSAAAYERAHVALPRALASACAQQGVRRVVHVSALGADGTRIAQAPSNYLRSKSQGEDVWAQMAHSQHNAQPTSQPTTRPDMLPTMQPMQVALLRPSVIFGREDLFLNRFAQMQRWLPVLPIPCADALFQPVWVDDVAQAAARLATDAHWPAEPLRIVQACGPQTFTLGQLARLAGALQGVAHSQGRPVLPLPAWVGQLQALLFECLPGEPVMSRDNLASMRVPNVAQPGVAGLAELGITPRAIASVMGRGVAGR